MTKSKVLNLVNNIPYVKGKGKSKAETKDSIIVYNSKIAYAFWNIKCKDVVTHNVCQIYPKFKFLKFEDIPEDLGEMKFGYASDLVNGGLLREFERLSK